jgi:hypothetical protein
VVSFFRQQDSRAGQLSRHSQARCDYEARFAPGGTECLGSFRTEVGASIRSILHCGRLRKRFKSPSVSCHTRVRVWRFTQHVHVELLHGSAAWGHSTESVPCDWLPFFFQIGPYRVLRFFFRASGRPLTAVKPLAWLSLYRWTPLCPLPIVLCLCRSMSLHLHASSKALSLPVL